MNTVKIFCFCINIKFNINKIIISFYNFHVFPFSISSNKIETLLKFYTKILINLIFIE